ncbi:MAG: DUF3841 domain-containing protein [bacterium]|nr:DUF3841 domain-containing protein [bacterium]
MIIKTIQPSVACRGGYTCDPKKSGILEENSEQICIAYQWLSAKMISKIGVGSESKYPLFGWFRYGGTTSIRRQLSTMRYTWTRSHIKELKERGIGSRSRHALLTIRKKEEEVLLVDSIGWFYVYTNQYLPIDESDALEHASKFGDGTTFSEEYVEAYRNPNYREEIVKSWDRCLDLTLQSDYFSESGLRKSIQAAFWGIERRDIISCEVLPLSR